ncbi:hypothetical protein UFOVP1444_43 [uncultured Caudovirales phage]|uniref:Uncharacterized protein n=1 Tax=uncultured Caudovirales phage TaxID=2100421 RepID=A0A6J5SG26_9CAUD|nr:hypothetical protein UFOVP1444_43 [uncultured Caudovirales phage]CAB5227999.1 hypothetical protein UFOVP1536_31 [uncultured Caudovirales phage]
MTFTKTPPTTPGFYAWRESEKDLIQTIHIIPDNEKESSGRARIERYQSLRDAYGEWCRLVPAGEVEKAYQEGYGDRPLRRSNWNNSRAKRVAEGKE